MNAPEKLPIKYAHPHNGMLWSGRGKKPRWVEEWLEAGNNLEELMAQAVVQAAPDALDAQFVRHRYLTPSPTNPRKTFPADKIAEMAESIRRHGILQPILVRPWPGDPGRFEIIAGERRWRAAQVADLALVPVLIRHLSDQEAVEFQVIENLHREDLHPLEEAEGYETLMQRHGYSAEELAAKIGKSKAYVYARLKLTALCDAARVAFREGRLSASTALLVARIPGAALQAKFLGAILNTWGDGSMSYRDAARHAQNHYMLRLAEARFDTTLADLLAGTAPCTTCPKRSGNQPELFADVASADVCTDPDCFAAKREAWAARKRAMAEAAGHTIITGKPAEDIVPPWAVTGQTRSESGYLALDQPCHAARHLAIPIEDAAPIEPEEPAEGADEDVIAAYHSAYDAWDKQMRAYEDREEAAIPTYRQLLAGASAPSVFVQHPRDGSLVECIAAAEIAPILEARGIQVPLFPSAGAGNSDKEREKIAREQTAFRRRLVESILFAAGEEELDVAELRLLAAGAFSRHDFEAQKLVVKVWTRNDARVERDTTERMLADIQEMDLALLHGLLRLLTLVTHIHVAGYSSDPTTTPAPLQAMADRWGIDPDVVRQQAAEDAAKPKKGRK
ncbi:MAG: ParB/RepB/Spo0J family partition protein [Pseudomonadota bacterium]|nr:ParB/RepB/Spo0J family partition protein [Pseudomonadota bacterium]MDP1905028.1 ParB/RepB/Spo0J family partition protein [Pseudomonadota bacterium]MDP2354270.1 ParB/RepB/Spo0J family partition protein [Pseudomonadota bacterium]